MAPSADLDRIAWKPALPFFLAHAVAIAAPFLVPATWPLVGLAAASYAVRMFAITAGYHRYFSHRSFRTSRPFQFLLALLAMASAQKGVLWWAGHHRHHHRFSDTPEDVHSPVQRSLWWSHAGWILCRRHDATRLENVRDLAAYPELLWLDRNHYVVVVAWAAAFLAAGGLPALLWGFFVSTVFLWHGTFTVNSLAHVIGRRRYATPDASRNSFWIALWTLGEGWHNNHHHYQSSANQGWFWWEVDVTFLVLRLLEKLGIVWDVRRPPESVRRPREDAAPAREAATG